MRGAEQPDIHRSSGPTPVELGASPHAIEQHSKSFSLASKLLSPEVRQGARSLYAWCRRADDAIDLAATRAAAKEQLATLFSELDAVYGDGVVADPTLAAFQLTVVRWQIPALYPQELLLGMRMDTECVHYQSQDDLMLYCYRVAGTVGLMMCHILGLSDKRGLAHAAHLGMAMQLTNICRDVREDYERGRVYLPQQALDLAGVGQLKGALTEAVDEERVIPAGLRNGLRRVVREQLTIAQKYYESGDAGLDTLGRRSSFAIASARHIYSAIGQMLERRSFDVFAPRAYVTATHKFLLIGKSARYLLKSGAPQACMPLPELKYEHLEKF